MGSQLKSVLGGCVGNENGGSEGEEKFAVQSAKGTQRS